MGRAVATIVVLRAEMNRVSCDGGVLVFGLMEFWVDIVEFHGDLRIRLLELRRFEVCCGGWVGQWGWSLTVWRSLAA